MSKKFLIIGHAGHGKSTLAEIIEDTFGLSYDNSSTAANDLFIYDALKDKYGYTSPELCYRDRVNHRGEWYDMISEFNSPNKARLAKHIIDHHDMYVGMRDPDELDESLKQGLFDHVIGIFDPNKPLESSASFRIDFWGRCDFVIPNSGTLKDLFLRVLKIRDLFLGQTVSQKMVYPDNETVKKFWDSVHTVYKSENSDRNNY